MKGSFVRQDAQL